ncbi:mitochondrial pyruvate dehydrogenase protein x component-like protein [Xylaria intraflava]|nr:mitochondrial pyruvate dehydrogenase protein x component-like protein [Xylaria intraflava]
MASFATATCRSARLVGRRVAQDATVRGFRTSVASLAAQNFTMPALSPTMTEGNIAAWKVKEGDSFSAGDVLLEIETDKASMDVEAQDDGILMKIMQGDGSKSVQVGTRIGVIAEPGDDISQLEIPADGKAIQTSAQKDVPSEKEGSKQAITPKNAGGQRQPRRSGGKAPPQKYPLYPSVTHLLKENGLDEAAIGEMTPTGPGGRLLKGDVLAYLGSVPSSRPEEIMKRFNHNAHLDLSNIKIAAPKVAAKTAEKVPTKEVPVPEERQVSLPVSLTAVIAAQTKLSNTLGTFIPVSTFLERATELANGALPLAANYQPTADELFNQVLGLDKVGRKASRGRYLPQIAAFPPPGGFTGVVSKPKPTVDIIDVLAGSARKPAPKTGPRAQPSISLGINLFSLTVPKDEEKRAKVFLQRMKSILESTPGKLVVKNGSGTKPGILEL